LDQVFKSKPIKRGGKIPLQQPKKLLEFSSKFTNNMSSQIMNNNIFTMASTFPNPYISRKLNNMDQAQIIKRERKDWLRLYYKTLKGLETMIDVQGLVKDIKKLAEEADTIMTEVERSILTASINNWVINTTNITQISEDLRYLVQSNMDKQIFQIQRMLADKLD